MPDLYPHVLKLIFFAPLFSGIIFCLALIVDGFSESGQGLGLDWIGKHRGLKHGFPLVLARLSKSKIGLKTGDSGLMMILHVCCTKERRFFTDWFSCPATKGRLSHFR